MADGVKNQCSAQRVLVVDDTKDAADTLAMVLKHQGHQVLVAYSGEAALTIAQQEPPEVVLLDVGLPTLNGYQVAATLQRGQRPRMP